MEKTNTKNAAAPAATEEVKVVIMGDGPAPEALRKAFPNAEFVDTSDPVRPVDNDVSSGLMKETGETLAKLRAATREGCCQCHKPVLSSEKLNGEPVPTDVEKAVRETAYSKLTSIAFVHGIGFNEQELDSLYRLSMAFGPAFAIDTAHSACRNFLSQWGK